jgi:hypothetical protein
MIGILVDSNSIVINQDIQTAINAIVEELGFPKQK